MSSEYENLFVGRTIERIEVGETFIEIYFTDGSNVTINSRGSGEHWISVDGN